MATKGDGAMSRDEDFMRFARKQSTILMATLRMMGGQTFTEADREAMIDGLDTLRVAMVQPVGTSAAHRVNGAVASAECDRAVMQVVCSAMQLWLSGKLGEVECDVE